MKKELHNPSKFDHYPAYSRAISIESPGRLHFIAGCTAGDENYNPLQKGDVVKQYYVIMEQLEESLKACGATWDDVVMRRIYVLNMDDFLNKIQTGTTQKHFWQVGAYPPSTLVEITRLSNKDFLIERCKISFYQIPTLLIIQRIVVKKSSI